MLGWFKKKEKSSEEPVPGSAGISSQEQEFTDDASAGAASESHEDSAEAISQGAAAVMQDQTQEK
jgi:hypothetical protein